jgi:serine/threonine protein kinase
MVAKSEALFSFLVSFSSIQLGPELGRGAFGVVYKASYNGETIACKMLSKETTKEMNQEEFMQEARTMSEIPQHPNVVKLVGFCRDETVCILSG